MRGKAPAVRRQAISASVQLMGGRLSGGDGVRQKRALDIVAVAPAVVDGMGGRKGNILRREQEARKQTRMPGAGSASFAAGVHCELSLDLVPSFSVNDGVMLSFIAAAAVRNAADIDRVGKNEIEVSA